MKKVHRWPFKFGIFASIQFVVLTLVAMPLYPGGMIADSPASRYSFFYDFFSELGMTVTSSGELNVASTVLFVIALTVAGLGLVVFFAAKPQLFRHKRAIHILSWIGSAFGVLSGLSYVGVAFTPANLLGELHHYFVLAAFESFFVAVTVYSVVIFLSASYPKRYAAVYLMFALLLAGYIWLMIQGPSSATLEGLMIQATGQKIIVYAAILCTLVQCWGALRNS